MHRRDTNDRFPAVRFLTFEALFQLSGSMRIDICIDLL